MIVTQRYEVSLLSCASDLLSTINNGFKLFWMRRQAKTARTKRNSSIEKNFHVRRFNVCAHGSYAEAFSSQWSDLDVFQHASRHRIILALCLFIRDVFSL